MQKIISIIRWILGLMLCLAALTGFSQGDKAMALLVIAIGLLLLPPVTKALFKKKGNDFKEVGQNQKQQAPRQQNFHSKLNELHFPDRVEAIVWHINAISKALSTGDLNLANLSYAKLIESIRQQNVNEKNNYDFELKAIRDEYEEFRNTYGLEYPPQFLPPSQRQKAAPPFGLSIRKELAFGASVRLCLILPPFWPKHPKRTCLWRKRPLVPYTPPLFAYFKPLFAWQYCQLLIISSLYSFLLSTSTNALLQS